MSINNGHPFECNGCGNQFTTVRFANKCCKQSSTDHGSGSVSEFSAELEDAAMQQDEKRWDAIMARAHFECSCGESYDDIVHAIQCRKCRTYTDDGYCTQVTDRALNHEVVWSIA